MQAGAAAALAAALLSLLVFWTAGRAARTGDSALRAIRQRGYLIAGVPLWTPPFGFPDRRGGWQGLDVSVARAVAAATLGNPEKVHFLPLSSGERLAAVQGGAADIVAAAYASAGAGPPTVPPGVRPVGPYFTDSLVLLVRRGHAPRRLSDLDGTIVGVLPGSPAGTALRAAAGPAGHPVLEETASAGLAARALALGQLSAVVGGAAQCRALAAYDPELQVQAAPALGQESYWVLVPADAPELAAAVRTAMVSLPRGQALVAALDAWSGAADNPPLPAPRALLTPQPPGA